MKWEVVRAQRFGPAHFPNNLIKNQKANLTKGQMSHGWQSQQAVGKLLM